MSADDCAVGLGGFFKTAAQNFGDGFRRNEILWKSHKIQRSDWASAHCENIRECIGGGDLSVSERVVNDRREEIGCLHERTMSIEAIHAGVVERVRVHENVAIAISG